MHVARYLFLKDDNMKVYEGAEVKAHIFSNLVMNGIQWSHSRICFFNFGESTIEILSMKVWRAVGAGLNVIYRNKASA
jgi:hypothetical protein